MSNNPSFEFKSFKLCLLDFYSINKLYNSGFVLTPDGSWLISDNDFIVGENEIFK